MCEDVWYVCYNFFFIKIPLLIVLVLCSTVGSLTREASRARTLPSTSSGTLPGDDLGKLVNLRSLDLQRTGLSGGSEEKYPLGVVTFPDTHSADCMIM